VSLCAAGFVLETRRVDRLVGASPNRIRFLRVDRGLLDLLTDFDDRFGLLCLEFDRRFLCGLGAFDILGSVFCFDLGPQPIAFCLCFLPARFGFDLRLFLLGNTLRVLCLAFGVCLRNLEVALALQVVVAEHLAGLRLDLPDEAAHGATRRFLSWLIRH
jgi:hypothetical protein